MHDLYLMNRLTFGVEFELCVMTLDRLELKVKVTAQGQWLWLWLMSRPPPILSDGRNSTLLLSRHQLRASAARREAWRGRDRRQRWSPARVGVITRNSGRSDSDHR